ncbi:MAG: hypothetical protein R2699_19485 [Acidimicrobiales bacterium]
MSGTDAAWHGQLGADTLDCTPSARTFEETMVSVSGDRLRLGRVEFEADNHVLVVPTAFAVQHHKNEFGRPTEPNRRPPTG